MGRARTPLGTHGKIFVSKTKAGTWQAITYYRSMDGRRRKLHHTARTKAAAERGLREYAAQITQTAGKTLSPHSTVAQAVELWWEEWQEEKRRPYNTIYTYQNAVQKKIIPGMGALQLIECTTAVISLFIKNLSRETSPSTAQLVRTILKSIFDTALRYDAVARNPIEAVKGPRREKKDVQILSIDEIEGIRQVLTDRTQLAFVLMLATGARIGEILALRWEDFEKTPAGTIVHITGTIVGKGRNTQRQPHRKAGEGSGISLYIPDFAVAALDAYATETCKQRRAGMIFIGSAKSNGFVSTDVFRWGWRRNLDGTPYAHVHPHMVRATVATMLANNTDISTASAQLGNTETVLRKHYWKRDALAPDARAILSVFGS